MKPISVNPPPVYPTGPIDVFPFSLSAVGVAWMLCDSFLPSAVPFLFAGLAITFAVSWYRWRRSWCPTPNVVISKSNVDSLHMEIGGQRHQEHWFEHVERSCLSSVQTQIMYNFRDVKLGLRVHLGETVSMYDFRKYMEALLPDVDPNARLPTLDLDIEIPKTDRELTGKKGLPQSLGLERSANLRKLTWKGPFVEHVFARRHLDLDSVRYSHLADLRLFDCNITPEALLGIFSACPHLVSCQVQHLARPNKTITNLGDDSAIVHHNALKKLTIWSTVSLQSIFKKFKPQNLETLNLRLSQSSMTGHTVHDEIARLPVNWQTTQDFELRAPMDYACIVYLKRFFNSQPTTWGRTHLFIDDRAPWYS